MLRKTTLSVVLGLLMAVLAIALALGGIGRDTPTAQADPAVGDVVLSLALPAPAAGADVGVAFDGTRLYWNNSSTNLHSCAPLACAGTLATVPVTDSVSGAAINLDAMAYDGTRDLIWAVQHNTDNIYQVNKLTGVATFQFSAAGKCVRCVGTFRDGLAFDGIDDALWWSRDVDSEVFKLTLLGGVIESFDVTPIHPDLTTCGNSGIAVGGANLYLGTNGCDSVIRADKATKLFVDQLVGLPQRVEDLECDPVTFAPTEVMWVRVLGSTVHAVEIEPDTCELGGGGREIEVDIDIKPGSFPNSINTKGRGTIPVAILSTPDFDATTEVDKTSLTFGHTGEETSLAKCTKSDEDVNGDGLLDIVCHFSTQATGFQVGDTEGILRGQTNDGTPIEGSDSVRIVH